MPQIIQTVITQHAEEAAFLWLLRDAAVLAPHYDLNDLAELDQRVAAHLDGLRSAGDAGWELVKQELTWEEVGEVFAAAVLAFESGDAGRVGPAANACTNVAETTQVDGFDQPSADESARARDEDGSRHEVSPSI